MKFFEFLMAARMDSNVWPHQLVFIGRAVSRAGLALSAMSLALGTDSAASVPW